MEQTVKQTDETTPKILVNRIRLPSGKFLESRYRWDFRKAEGFFIDGGSAYIRTDMLDASNVCTVYDTDSIEVIRDAFRWGTNGKNLDKSQKLVKLKDLSNLHVQAIVRWIEEHISAYSEHILLTFKRELQYRDIHGIYIEDKDEYTADYSSECVD